MRSRQAWGFCFSSRSVRLHRSSRRRHLLRVRHFSSSSPGQRCRDSRPTSKRPLRRHLRARSTRCPTPDQRSPISRLPARSTRSPRSMSALTARTKTRGQRTQRLPSRHRAFSASIRLRFLPVERLPQLRDTAQSLVVLHLLESSLTSQSRSPTSSTSLDSTLVPRLSQSRLRTLSQRSQVTLKLSSPTRRTTTRRWLPILRLRFR